VFAACAASASGNLMKNIERRLYEFHSTGGRLAKITETDRARLLSTQLGVSATRLLSFIVSLK